MAAILLLALSVNPAHAVSAVFAKESGSPTLVTEEFQFDMEPIDALVLNEGLPGDVFISNLYGKYAEWRGYPEMRILLTTSKLADEAHAGELQQYISDVVDFSDSGWIILDGVYHEWQGLDRENMEIAGRNLEYLGQIAGQLVWRWKSDQ